MVYKPPPKKPFKYDALITGTFRLVWRHKFLWFFGLFAGTGSSLGGWNCNYSSNVSEDVPNEVADWVSTHLALILSLVAAAVVIAILLWLWSIICQGAVIQSVRDIKLKKPVSFGAAFRLGIESFTRLLLFYLFLFVIFFGISIIIGAAIVFLVFLAASGDAGAAAVTTIASLLALAATVLLVMSFGYLACCTAWLVGPILITLFFTYSLRAAVLEGSSPVAALRRGWRMLVDNLSRSLLLFLLSVGLSIGGGIAITIATIVTAIPSIIAWVFAYNYDFSLAWIIIASVLALPVLVVAVIATALMNTYFTVYWTDIYLKFSGGTDETAGPDEELQPVASPGTA